MHLLVGTIEVHAIPAIGEAEGRHDALLTNSVWESESLRSPRAKSIKTSISKLSKPRRLIKTSRHDIANEHTESLAEQ